MCTGLVGKFDCANAPPLASSAATTAATANRLPMNSLPFSYVLRTLLCLIARRKTSHRRTAQTALLARHVDNPARRVKFRARTAGINHGRSEGERDGSR